MVVASKERNTCGTICLANVSDIIEDLHALYLKVDMFVVIVLALQSFALH